MNTVSMNAVSIQYHPYDKEQGLKSIKLTLSEKHYNVLRFFKKFLVVATTILLWLVTDSHW